MSVTDHYPRKKRRLCMKTKTPTRSSRKETITNSQFQEISVPLKSQLLFSPAVTGSSDESSLEIGWDNNSPSPTTLRSGKCRRNNKQKTSDIAKILRGVTRKKKRTEMKADTSYDENYLSTWMQNSLATVCVNENKLTDYKSKRSDKHKKKKGASTFNEELKRFMEQVMPSNLTDSSFQKSSRSPHLKTEDAESPNLFESTQNDSLIIVDNFDDLILDELEKSMNSNKSQNSFALIKTPKLRRNLYNKNPTKNEGNLLIKKMTTPKIVSDKSNIKSNIKENECCTSKKIQTPEFKYPDHMKNDPFTLKCDNINIGNSIDFDEELDGIISLNDSKHKLSAMKDTGQQQTQVIDILSDDESDVDINKNYTKIHGKMVKPAFPVRTRNIISTPKIKQKKENFINFDDDFVIDDNILCDLEEEFKCKSQETPNVVVNSVSCEQRKLKKRCHTSPFPISRKASIKSPRMSKIGNNYDIMDTSNDNQQCKNVAKQSVKRSHDDVENKTNIYNNKMMNSSQVTQACRRPFIPPFKNSSKSSNQSRLRLNLKYKNPLDLSAIGNPVRHEDINQPESFKTSKDSSISSFSSTQKCSLTEIEKKRKEAQLRLKERLRKK